MDPLSAVGIASAVVQFIDFGLRIADRLSEFNSSNPSEVPKSMLAISTQLPLLLNALQKIKHSTSISHLDIDTKCILKGMVSGCMTQVIEIESMINEISRAPGDSFKLKIKKVFVSLKYDEKVCAIERSLHTYISVLILHHVIDSADAPLELAEDTFFDVREKRIESFIERPKLMAELDDNLREAAWSQAKTPSILLLTGDKGVGKTQLALEYCHQAHTLGQFKTVFWVDAASLENLSLGFESIYATIRHSMDGSRQDKISFVTGFLNDLWHPWLLVLDNYNIFELYNNILEFLPSRGSGGIVLISRDREGSALGTTLLIPKFIPATDQTRLNNLLSQSIQRSDIEGIQTAINQGADVNTLIWDQWPCLHRAALLGLESTVSLLLQHGADPSLPGVQIMKPLYWASSNGHLSICHLLLDHEDKTETKSAPADYQSAFNAAAEEGHLNILSLIFSRREIGLNHKNQRDETPLQVVARKGYLEVLKFLIDEGAIKTDPSQIKQALLSASSSGHLQILKLLYTSSKLSLNTQDEQGRTPLCHSASLRNSDTYLETGVEMTHFLLENSADPNAFGNTDGPLHTAAIHNHTSTLSLLLSHGADPTKEANGWSPLTNAIKYKSPEAITILLETKISDPTMRQTWINNALSYASRTGERNVVLQLLNAGADINVPLPDSGVPARATPLLLAILNGEVKTAQFLIRKGARQDLADKEGRLPLPLAAENGHELLVRDLIKAGGEVDMKSGENEDTPLILAAGKGHEKVVRVLLKEGAGTEVGNKFGDVALDVAEEKGWEKVVELLGG